WDSFVEPRFTSSRFPGLQIAHNYEVLAADLQLWNTIFFDDFTEFARGIACLICRARNIQTRVLWLLLAGICSHSVCPTICPLVWRSTKRVVIDQGNTPSPVFELNIAHPFITN